VRYVMLTNINSKHVIDDWNVVRKNSYCNILVNALDIIYIVYCIQKYKDDRRLINNENVFSNVFTKIEKVRVFFFFWYNKIYNITFIVFHNLKVHN